MNNDKVISVVNLNRNAMKKGYNPKSGEEYLIKNRCVDRRSGGTLSLGEGVHELVPAVWKQLTEAE